MVFLFCCSIIPVSLSDGERVRSADTPALLLLQRGFIVSGE